MDNLTKAIAECFGIGYDEAACIDLGDLSLDDLNEIDRIMLEMEEEEMLTWQWSEKVGYIKVENQGDYEINLYRGNAMFIAISEWKKGKSDMYSPYAFFCDEDHAKNCLGLKKNENYIFHGLKEIHMSAELNKDDIKVIKLWSEAITKWDLDVRIVLENLNSNINM